MTAPTKQAAYNRQQAAQMYGVSLSTIERAIHSGALRAKKVGRLYLLSEKALQEWFEGLDEA